MNVWLFLLLMGGLLVALVLILFWHPQRSLTKTNTFSDRKRTNVVFRDDEQYWPGEIFYNNPDDPALFVPKRFGFGWTLNFGHPQAKLFLITLLVLLLLLGVVLPLVVALFGGGSMHPSGCHTLGCQP